MLIVGAKGFAKEVLEIILQYQNNTNEIVFFDNVSNDLSDILYNKYRCLRSFESAAEYFRTVDKHFVLGVGNPKPRYELAKKMIDSGGELTSMISPFSKIGMIGTTIEPGCNIMTGTIITSDIKIQEGALLNLNCTIGHDSIIERYCELSPGVHISGHCHIKEFSVLGTGSVVIPKMTIGKNSIVAAGSVVTKDVPDNVLVAGVPAVIKKELPS